ncbi:MAG: transposase [Planctomycetia bacterium]|nr:transposase [Planctomycetia bacterium]
MHLHACVTDGVFVPAAAEAARDTPPAFLPARPITPANLAALTARVRRRVIRWFRMQRLLDAAAAANMLAWENTGFSVDASVRITLVDRDVPRGCCDAHHKPRSHDTSRIAWAKLMARVGEEFPLECPACGGDIRLIAFITEPGPIRKILTHLGEPLEPAPIAAARGPPTDWGELVQVHDGREAVQVLPDELPDELPAIDIHSL